MKASRRAWLGLALLTVVGGGAFLGLTQMGLFNSHQRDFRRLLGREGASLADDSAIAAWAPDPNYQPLAYYLQRDLDEAGFRQLASQTGLTVAPTPEVAEAVWRLPAGLAVAGWSAQDIPPGAGLQVSGTVAAAAVWLRWYRGKAYIVVQTSAP